MDFLVTGHYTFSTSIVIAEQFQFLENGIRCRRLHFKPAAKRKVPLEGTKVLIFVPKSRVSQQNILMRM